MKKAKSILWGLVLAAVGVLLGLRALDIVDFSIFFDGWWTLFLIVPCAIGLVTDRDKTGNLVGLAIGVFLLLACQDVVGFDKLWKLLVPLSFGIRETGTPSPPSPVRRWCWRRRPLKGQRSAPCSGAWSTTCGKP